MDEILESDVIFSDHHAHEPNRNHCELVTVQQNQNSNPKNPDGGKNTAANSVPVNIPDSMMMFSVEAEDDDGDNMVPPHVMMEQRISGEKMAHSVCTGNGRTLKGRDLSQVRNSVLRMTGFIEA
ncbi:putative senescence regulator S40 [Lupinus albus]|uniref:Putative senescence regulator S40 n=1 Tax=Lupinus albus TaxID=3870 RepID=A0A6A4NQ88_LUPAL|nr:putative senescence regulator S40 [Lupinus albus]